MNRSGLGMGNRDPVEMFQGGSLDDMVEALRRAGVIPPEGRGENGEPSVFLVAPALEIIDVTLLNRGAAPASGAIGGIPANATYQMDTMVDVRTGIRLLFILRSSLNQAVTMQVIGNDQNQPGGQGINIGATTVLAANGDRAGFAVNLDDAPYPWIGMTFATGATGPTGGALFARAYGLRWRHPVGGVQ